MPALGPLLDVRIPDSPETSRISTRFRKARLEEVAVDLLAALLTAPTLLVFDDAHLMDNASVDLLGRLVGSLSGRPWLVLITRRDLPTGYQPESDTAVTTVRPGPLDAEAALSLASGGLDDDALPPHELALLAERANGNPFFLRTLVAAARASGGVDALPDSIESLLNSQIDHLPPGERTILRHAAVLGLAFNEADLRALLADREVPTSRSSMRRLGEFIEVEGHGRLRFRHALIRDAAYAGLPIKSRRALHGRVGQTLEAAAAGDVEEQAELLALHFFEAGRMDKAWRYGRAAADRAVQKYAYVAAAEFLTRATTAARHLGDLAPLDLAEAYEGLADARLRVGVLADARAAYRAARQLVPDDPIRTADLLRKEAQVEYRLDRVPQSMRTLTRAMRVIGMRVIGEAAEPDVIAERARLDCAYARCREKQGRYREAVRWGRQAEQSASEAGDRRALAEAYEALHSASSMAGLDQPEPYGLLALRLFEELDDREAQSRALNNLAVLAWFEGRGPEALAMFERARDTAAEAGDTLGAAASAHNVGDVLLRQGRLAEAEAVLSRLLPTFKGLGSEDYWASTLRWLGLAAVRAGRVEEGREQIERARAVFVGLGLAAEVAETDAAVVEALLASAEPAAAVELAADATARASALGADYLLPSLHRLHGAALLEAGQPAEAIDALNAAMRACGTEGASEVGFILADLARANAETDPAASLAYAEQSAQALAALGHLG